MSGVTKVRKCESENAAGGPCGAPAVAGGRFCFWHSPDTAAKRRAAQRRGGFRARGADPEQEVPEVRISTAADALKLLELAVQDCLRARPSLDRARTLGNLASIALRGAELVGLEERLQALEAQARPGLTRHWSEHHAHS